ncbi:serine protease [Cubamyces lactineus]|nr:serine protease [Cubamyces lactineus]
MKILVVLAGALWCLSSPALAAPGTSHLARNGGSSVAKTNPHSYIVKLKDGVTKRNQLEWLATHYGNSSKVIHTEWESNVLHGFAGIFHPDAMDALRSSPDVEFVSEDNIVRINSIVTQTNATWGLQRITQFQKLATQDVEALTYNYTYNDSSAGAGVDIYVIDTGIYINHTEFGGRARWGATFGGYPDEDGSGHGTHVSGTAAGMTYGVAKRANLIAVRAFSDLGFANASDIISGINWVSQQVAASGRPSIASMSFESDPCNALDTAVASLTSSGIHSIVAAGNEGSDAGNVSPARVPSVVTVGATDITDTLAWFSNYGSIVDLFAPGDDIISAYIGDPTASLASGIMSGTSMSTPHISGLVATIISRDGNDTPAAISAKLQQLATKGVLSGLPSGTANDLARTEV